MPKSMGKGAASPSKFLILQQKSPGLAQNKWKEHPSKLMGQQRRGTASCVPRSQETDAVDRAKGCSGIHRAEKEPAGSRTVW